MTVSNKYKRSGAVDYIARALAARANLPTAAVTSVTAGDGLLGGTITTTGTIDVDVPFFDNLYEPISTRREVATFLNGPLLDSEVILVYRADFDGELSADLSDWRFNVIGTITSAITFAVSINGSDVGSVSVSTSNVVTATTTGGLAQAFSSGNVIRITADSGASGKSDDIQLFIAAILNKD